MQKIIIINGPNLNMLGRREPEIYGHKTLDDIRDDCLRKAKDMGLEVDFRQSNHEGEIVSWIQESLDNFNAIIINAAAYTHTSVAIHDALKLLDIPIIELHISDPKKRDEFRHHSYIEPLASAHISGQGPEGYLLALDKVAELL